VGKELESSQEQATLPAPNRGNRPANRRVGVRIVWVDGGGNQDRRGCKQMMVSLAQGGAPANPSSSRRLAYTPKLFSLIWGGCVGIVALQNLYMSLRGGRSPTWQSHHVRTETATLLKGLAVTTMLRYRPPGVRAVCLDDLSLRGGRSPTWQSHHVRTETATPLKGLAVTTRLRYRPPGVRVVWVDGGRN